MMKPSKSYFDASHQLLAAVQYSRWEVVVKLVKSNACRAEEQCWAIDEAARYASEKFVCQVVDHCADDQVDSLLSCVIRRHLWKSVDRLLLHNCSRTKHRWAIEEASENATDNDFVNCILPHCLDEDLEAVMTHLVTRGLWKSVGHVLECNISHALRAWAIEEAGKNAEDRDFLDHIIERCTEEEIELALTHVLSRGLWESVTFLLQEDMSCAQHRLIVEKASSCADEFSLEFYILPHCSKESLEYALEVMVSQSQWKHLRCILQLDISCAKHTWAIEEACKCADSETFITFILPSCLDNELKNILIHMVSRGVWEAADSDLVSDSDVKEHVLSQLVARCCWKAVGDFLTREISGALHQWAVEEACQHASDDTLANYILPHCSKEEMEHVLAHLVSRCLMNSISYVLQRNISKALHKWAIEEASKCASYFEFADGILPYCHDEELEHILTQLVFWGLWVYVGLALERGIDDARHRWVIEEASKLAHDEHFTEHIMPHGFDKELEDVLPHLLSRGLWKSVALALQRNIGSTQRRWALEEASKLASDGDLYLFILPICSVEELEMMSTCIASRGLGECLNYMLEQSISTPQRRQIIREGCKQADDHDVYTFLLHHCSEDDLVFVLPSLVAKRNWRSTRHVLHDVISNILFVWVTSEYSDKTQDSLFWKLMRGCRIEVTHALPLRKAVVQETKPCIDDLAGRLSWDRELCELFFSSLLHIICFVMCSEDKEYQDSTPHTRKCVSHIFGHLISCIHENAECIKDDTSVVIENRDKWISVFSEIAITHQSEPLFVLHFLQGLNVYQASRQGENDDSVLMMMLTVLPLFPEIQSLALRTMQHENRWDVISQACLSHTWEHDRRQLFTAVVELNLWDIVKQWADHSLQNDQRLWALDEAFKEKQWEAYLLLADHGLTQVQLMSVHYKIAKHGDPKTVMQMCGRGGDVTEVRNMLFNSLRDRWKVKHHKNKMPELQKRCDDLLTLENTLKEKCRKCPLNALRGGFWHIVFFKIFEKCPEYIFPAMVQALETRAWHVVAQLVRIGISDAYRDRLFPQMVKEQQWGVCLKLLEYGVSINLCLDALPRLIEMNQWFLVSTIMVYDGVDDVMRHQVMQLAFKKREGTLFWDCLRLLGYEYPCVEERQKLFHKAISRDIWQAVKPLVLPRDNAGNQHRDIALLESIEQHLWNVVDHCVLYGADINMKDDAGETPLHRETRKQEWRAVREIVYRDGDSNLLDMNSRSVLNCAISCDQWETVEFLLKYANVHLHARTCDGWYTPLQRLIDKHQGDLIDMSLMWCSDQWRGVNKEGETLLHVACLMGLDRRTIYRLLLRKVNPWALTKNGLSAFVYAILSRDSPQRLVADCIQEGIHTHQPSLTNLQQNLVEPIMHSSVLGGLYFRNYFLDFICDSTITSPMLFAVLCDLPVVAHMLYESGSCSYRELYILYTELPKLLHPETEEGRKLKHECRQVVHVYSKITYVVEKFMPFLREVATTPCTLKALCRMVISYHLNCHNRRRYDVNKVSCLGLTEELKSYLSFSDLADPNYGTNMM